uniref:Uncharacterized protein n=1 Tax=Arundo donax TaxID=35708 RepID=A0A0A8YPT6_ARUDO
MVYCIVLLDKGFALMAENSWRCYILLLLYPKYCYHLSH